MTPINLTICVLAGCLLVFQSHQLESGNLIEDISNQGDEDDDHLQTFPTPPPIGTPSHRSTTKNGENFQIFSEKDIVTNPDPYRKQNPFRTQNRSEKKKGKDESENTQIVPGIPDISDPCFRRYENSIIVNAQPYERRSSTGLLNCKSHCLSSQSGSYTCRSFVYDNINLVCDLFAHVGDQSPARLLKFQTRDYFEPTNAAHCLALLRDSSTSPPSIRVETTTPHDTSAQCPRGKLPTFLRTDGFELFNHDEQEIEVLDVSECAIACKSNTVNNQQIDCKSFDYVTSSSKCLFTSEAAVPVGNGQLKQRDDAIYHEKICVSQSYVESCPTSFFSRHPQMILVGFAESVADSPNFDHCFDTCLNSWQLFGFNCTSGMYYFEESQLNCILNSENRLTQPDLFTEENTDIVDYFEVDCKSPNTRHRMAGVRNFETDAIESEKMIVADTTTTTTTILPDDPSRWESWSECVDGKQTRRKSCNNFNVTSSSSSQHRRFLQRIEDCAEEVRDCNQITNLVPTKQEIAQVKQQIRRDGFHCPLNTCCKVFQSCSYGLRHNSHTKQLEWCRRPCDSIHPKSRARLLK